jgi:hypothetical protein
MTLPWNMDVSDENAIALNRNRTKKAIRNNIMAPFDRLKSIIPTFGLNIMIQRLEHQAHSHSVIN